MKLSNTFFKFPIPMGLVVTNPFYKNRMLNGRGRQ